MTLVVFAIPSYSGNTCHEFLPSFTETLSALGAAGIVSAKQRDDVVIYDAWGRWSAVRLTAVTNGDVREITARKFRNFLLGRHPYADVEHPDRVAVGHAFVRGHGDVRRGAHLEPLLQARAELVELYLHPVQP